MDEVVKAFLLESHENLLQVEQELMQLEERPGDRELLASIFRTIHTIKGTCGFLGYPRLEALSHAGENLLSALRDGAIALTREIADELLTLVDSIRKILASIEATGGEGDSDYTALANRLSALRSGEVQPAAASQDLETDADELKKKPSTGDELIAVSVFGEGETASRAAADVAPEVGAEVHAVSVVESTVRVDVGLLDRLMDLVGELVLARNQLMQIIGPTEDVTHVAAYRRVDRVTNDLQTEVMKTRMQPIDSVFQMLPRLMRDLAAAFGKRARLVIEGGDTELDRTMLDAIRDPLVHLLRNALDHGIEGTAERRRLGKPAEGRVLVRAFHQGGQVTVEVSDDGAGIDPAKLRVRAVELGLITQELADAMSDTDALSLIFTRGFSTNREVTNYSGRGVGMDVVRVNVDRVGGSVEVASEVGVGTTTRLRIPLTLAIIPALIVVERGHRYAIPQVNIQELVRVEATNAGKGIEDFNGVPVFRLRGQLLPVVFLGDELWGRPEVFELAGEGLGDSRQILVLQADDRLFGLVVESIEGTQEIVVKPLNSPVTGIATLAGATILGDGAVALILDAVGLAQRAGVVTESRTRRLVSRKSETGVVTTTGEQLLLMRVPAGGQAVLPLDRVVRLEQVPKTAVEHLGGHEVVQHRGEILSLVRVIESQWEDEIAGSRAAASNDGETLPVVVLGHQGRRFGLIVSDIVDIMDETPELQEVGRREGVLGSMVVRSHVAEALDVEGLIVAAQRAAAERERLAQQALDETMELGAAQVAGEVEDRSARARAGGAETPEGTSGAAVVRERPKRKRRKPKVAAEPADSGSREG